MKTLKNSTISIMITAVILLVMPQYLAAQTSYKLLPGKDVNVKVLGSSNVHDWNMTATGIESQGEFKFDDDQLKSLNAFNLSVTVKSLKSEHESMDNRTYKAIKADDFPKVTYKLGSAVITTVAKNKFLIKATGDLTISGATQTITLMVNAVVNADNTITCIGSQKVKLTDYKIQPPSFMLGAMKVANDLTIQFNLNCKK